MFTNMEQWNDIRRRVLVEGVSRRQVQRETGMHRKTIKKVLEFTGCSVIEVCGTWTVHSARYRRG